MTDRQAQTVANLILAAAGLAAAYVVLTNPPLRRIAGRASRFWLGASVPSYFLNEARRAWVESKRTA